jgi:alpha-N-arabinofuranosidase
LVYLKLVNASSLSQPIDISITGANSVEKIGTLVTLTGSSLAETNTITSPNRIIPTKSKVNSAGTKFSHVIPPYSVQVLELHAK